MTDKMQKPAASANSRQHRRDQIKFFTIDDVAASLDVSTRTVRRSIDHKKLVAHKFGGAVRIAEGDLKAFIARHRLD
jgi:excisionase family DNA binding protein